MAYNYPRWRPRRSSTYGRRPNYKAPYRARSTYSKPRVVYVDRPYKKKRRAAARPRPLYPEVNVLPAAVAAPFIPGGAAVVAQMEVGNRVKREREA